MRALSFRKKSLHEVGTVRTYNDDTINKHNTHTAFRRRRRHGRITDEIDRIHRCVDILEIDILHHGYSGVETVHNKTRHFWTVVTELAIIVDGTDVTHGRHGLR